MGNRDDVRRREALAANPALHPELQWYFSEINSKLKGRSAPGLATTTTTTTTTSTTSTTTTTTAP
jgi:hypothetical protein